MDLRDLRYFETIAELQHVGRASAEAAPDAAGADELRAPPRGGLRRRRCSRRRDAASGSRRRARCCSSGRSACASTSRTRSARSRASARAWPGTSASASCRPQRSSCCRPWRGNCCEEAPEVTLRTVVGLVDTLKPLLRAGEIDMMVGTESPAEAGYVSELLAEDAIVVAASAKHELFRGRADPEGPDRLPLGAAAPGRADARLARPHVRPQAPAAAAGAGRNHDAADAADADRADRAAELHLASTTSRASRAARTSRRFPSRRPRCAGGSW